MKDKETILVTGGAGFIGSHLCERLLREKKKVVCLDNFSNFYPPQIKEDNIKNFKNNADFSLIRGDILDTELLEKIFSKRSISKIIHLAAIAGVRQSLANPSSYIDIDIKGTVNLLEAAKKYKIAHFIFGSSSSVYGTGSRIPFREDEKNTIPVSPYAASKLSAEIFCQTYTKLYKIPTTILRFFTVYGPRQRPEMAIHKFTRLIRQGKSLTQFGSGESVRDYTFIDDVIEGVVKSMQKKFSFEVFNLGNSKTVRLSKMIKTIGERLGIEPKISKTPDRLGDVPITCADISKAKKMLGWKPEVSFEQGVERFVNWYLEKEKFLNLWLSTKK